LGATIEEQTSISASKTVSERRTKAVRELLKGFANQARSLFGREYRLRIRKSRKDKWVDKSGNA
jgi:hypothetical protein